VISQEAIQKILGIGEKVHVTAPNMAKQFKATFYPNRSEASDEVRSFADRFEKSLKNLGVEIVPFDSVWETIPFDKRIARFFKYILNDIVWLARKSLHLTEINFFLSFNTIVRLSSGRRIKKGICIVCVGEQDADKLPMQFISSFKTNSIITIVDFPKNIDASSNFSAHFDAAMSLFAYHMTNIAIAVDRTKWMVYNFNASHPIYSIADPEFDTRVLKAIIPKVVAPISPHKLNEFRISNDQFSVSDKEHQHVIEEMKQGGLIFDRTGLYPSGKKIDELPFRHNFHRLIGKLHLDNRSGMSFGFIAFQMPTKIFMLQSLSDFTQNHLDAFSKHDFYCDQSTKIIYICIDIGSKKMVMRVPDVWVMTLRSGADKTHFNPKTDLLKIGLVNGEMHMQLPLGLEVDRDYRPSFDTKVILAHAIGNALIAQLSNYIKVNSEFVKNIETAGVSISHWHGYFNEKLLPKGLLVYGRDNPHVSCSSPQSAIYALQGKLEAFSAKMKSMNKDSYVGDVHIEPHHGINISYPSLTALAQYILNNAGSTELGNKYL